MGVEIERAHGDGMTIGYDSHEAFEEVLWRAFWPGISILRTGSFCGKRKSAILMTSSTASSGLTYASY